VRPQPYFNDPSFPDNMPAIWDALFGYLEGATNRAVVMGEWGESPGSTTHGPHATHAQSVHHACMPPLRSLVSSGGPYVNKSAAFVEALGAYMVRRCLSDNIYWVLNPDSHDTGGLLKDDWISPRSRRLDLLRRIQPRPSRVVRDTSTGAFVLSPGAAVNPSCEPDPQANMATAS
jgi:endoglucanase